jgi:hypothetical protein
MIPFKKKQNVNPEQPSQNLQQLQQDFNQALFELGNMFYRKHMIKENIAAIDSEINSQTQKLDKMGVEAAKLRTKIQEEVKATVEKGATDVKEAE